MSEVLSLADLSTRIEIAREPINVKCILPVYILGARTLTNPGIKAPIHSFYITDFTNVNTGEVLSFELRNSNELGSTHRLDPRKLFRFDVDKGTFKKFINGIHRNKTRRDMAGSDFHDFSKDGIIAQLNFDVAKYQDTVSFDVHEMKLINEVSNKEAFNALLGHFQQNSSSGLYRRAISSIPGDQFLKKGVPEANTGSHSQYPAQSTQQAPKRRRITDLVFRMAKVDSQESLFADTQVETTMPVESGEVEAASRSGASNISDSIAGDSFSSQEVQSGQQVISQSEVIMQSVQVNATNVSGSDSYMFVPTESSQGRRSRGLDPETVISEEPIRAEEWSGSPQPSQAKQTREKTPIEESHGITKSTYSFRAGSVNKLSIQELADADEPYTLKYIEKNLEYEIEATARDILPQKKLAIKPHGRTLKVCEFSIVFQDGDSSIQAEFHTEDEVCEFLGVLEVEDILSDLEGIESRISRMLNFPRRSITLQRRIKKLKNGYSYSYWHLQNSLQEMSAA